MAPLLALALPAFGEVLRRLASLIPDKEAAARALAEAEDAAATRLASIDLAQLEVNKAEAGHASLFVAGWRPAIGWIGAVALGCYFIPTALVGVALWAWVSIQTGVLQPRPDLGTGDVLALILPMLGMGALRTIDKLNGTDTRDIGSATPPTAPAPTPAPVPSASRAAPAAFSAVRPLTADDLNDRALAAARAGR